MPRLDPEITAKLEASIKADIEVSVNQFVARLEGALAEARKDAEDCMNRHMPIEDEVLRAIGIKMYMRDVVEGAQRLLRYPQ